MITPGELRTVDVEVVTLRVADHNPRTISKTAFDRLKRSMEADPEMLRARPVIALPSGEVVAGNMRLRAAQSLGWQTVPTIYVDLDERRAREWMLRDNNSFGEWQEDQLSEMLFELKEAGSPLDLLGFEQEEIDRLLESVGVGGDGELGEDDADLTPPEEPITKLGDLWILGEHRLLCGDSTSKADIERLMNGERAALLWTDPPYGVSYVGKTKEALTIQNDGSSGLPALLRAAYTYATQAMEPGAPFYVAHPPGELHLEFWLAAREAGWRIHEELIWAKDSMVLGHSDYHFKHEPILYGWMPGVGRSGRGDYEGSRWYGDHSQTSLLEFDRPKRSEDHPTMKPTELIEYCMGNSSRRGDIVLDLFGGSGSTLIAAEQSGRVAYVVEIDPVYCDVIVRRWEHVTGKTAVRQEAVPVAG